MKVCNLDYIPERLHRNNRTPIDIFEIGEQLYMRCHPHVIENPYKDISITELSHNRSGLQSETLCNPRDVLFNIKEEESEQQYSELMVCTIAIKSLNDESKYFKIFRDDKNSVESVGSIELIHEPEDCMYPHCVFRVKLNSKIVTYNNYKQTLKKSNRIRAAMKEEFASMIVQGKLSQE